MKKWLFSAILAISVVFLNGCCAKNGGMRGWGTTSLVLPPILTVVLTNNTTNPLEVYENGRAVVFKNTTGQYQPAILAPGGVISRGYYNFLGRRDLVITVRAICPPQVPSTDPKAVGCVPGQYAGTESRRFTVYTDGQYHADHWEINYIRGPGGVY